MCGLRLNGRRLCTMMLSTALCALLLAPMPASHAEGKGGAFVRILSDNALGVDAVSVEADDGSGECRKAACAPSYESEDADVYVRQALEDTAEADSGIPEGFTEGREEPTGAPPQMPDERPAEQDVTSTAVKSVMEGIGGTMFDTGTDALQTSLSGEGGVYTVSIPDRWDASTGEAAIIAAMDGFFAGERLLVQVSSKNGFALTNATTALPYRLAGDGLLDGTGVIAAYFSGAGGTLPLRILIDGAPDYAGTYSDTLTFTVSVVSGG